MFSLPGRPAAGLELRRPVATLPRIQQGPHTAGFLAGAPVEIELDLWPLVAPLVPLLEELERVEAMAAGEDGSKDPAAIAYPPSAD